MAAFSLRIAPKHDTKNRYPPISTVTAEMGGFSMIGGTMLRMSKKRKLELSFFLNDRERLAYNDLCRKCQHECKLQFTFFLFIKAVDGSHIIFKSPLNPHVAHVAVALEPFALQAAGCLKGLLKYPPPFIDKTSFIIIKGLFLPHGYVNPYIVRMVFCAISFLQQPFCQSIVFLMFFFSHPIPPYSPWQGRIPK